MGSTMKVLGKLQDGNEQGKKLMTSEIERVSFCSE